MTFLIPGQETTQLEDTGRVSSPRGGTESQPEVGGTWQIPVIELGEKEPWKDISVQANYLMIQGLTIKLTLNRHPACQSWLATMLMVITSPEHVLGYAN